MPQAWTSRTLSKFCSGRDEGKNGRESVEFLQGVSRFSIDPDSNWLVLMRCSPYSDMKTTDDRELMFEKFNDIHKLLEHSCGGALKTVPSASCS
ncbi:MAG: hypothetical protein ACLR0N_14675 [Bilophila wadsworthia]